ncbi:PREDICTED: tropomyosin-1, isoforms 33/34-like [Dipodomys ordii]|uniref:Tropomyosin-1, isoforms 33/34-like n=1 Tax=Dipodomys ordii TaxID=10020 RepID=A0A1S3FSL0_DIPOR|nr:PREDICTED: tropomyosin-1, isoforms 33/34-like [Dipodomys ordii]XP_042542518.1 tropomyosin-1, isoforms 33/34-like [Dipodomys spectabilis]
MEIWDSLNRRYLDFIKKRGAGREESWLFRGLREPDRGRAEELARRTLGPGSDFLPKKGKAGKKCAAAAGWRAARAPSRAGEPGPPPETLLPEPGAGSSAAPDAECASHSSARPPGEALPPPAVRPGPRAAAMHAAEPPPPEDSGTTWKPNF